MDIAEKVKNTRWHRDWAGQEFLLQASMDVDANFDYMREFIGITHGAYLLLLDGDGCSGNYPQEPHERLSLVAAERARDPDFLAHWCSEFKNLSDRVLPVLLGDTEELLSRLPEIYPSYERYGTYQIACKAAFNSLAADYNANMAKINFAFCNIGTMPAGADIPLPREFRQYIVD